MRYLLNLLIFVLMFNSTNVLADNPQDTESVVTKEPIEINARQQQAFDQAASDPRKFREDLKQNCPHFGTVLLDTAETIQLGTRVFNAGGVSLTKRIYEGTLYKILFVVQDDCVNLSDALTAGLLISEEQESYHDKAWALRNTLDLIMGGPPNQAQHLNLQ